MDGRCENSCKTNKVLRTKRDMSLALMQSSNSALEEKVQQVGAGRKSLDAAFLNNNLCITTVSFLPNTPRKGFTLV